MPSIHYEGRSYTVGEAETVLDALLRNGVPAAHSCKAGVCGSCLLRASAGAVSPAAQKGLKDAWQAQGYFLACLCKPCEDLTLSAVGDDAQTAATIAGLHPLSTDVLRVQLRLSASLDHRAGQYITLQRADGLARSYSIASLPDAPEIELHVRRIRDGRMSNWLHDEAQPGDTVTVKGPSGDCFYEPGTATQPLLLVGAGTGLAPLYGIVQDALRQGHSGPIHLFHGARHAAGLYLVEELRELATRHSPLHYHPVLRALDEAVLEAFPKLAGWRGYLCGDPALVQLLKRRFFLAGMGSKQIHADAFLPAAPATVEAVCS